MWNFASVHSNGENMQQIVDCGFNKIYTRGVHNFQKIAKFPLNCARPQHKKHTCDSSIAPRPFCSPPPGIPAMSSSPLSSSSSPSSGLTTLHLHFILHTEHWTRLTSHWTPYTTLQWCDITHLMWHHTLDVTSHTLYRILDSQGCTILHGVLTISSDIGRFEQYRNGTYPTRPDKIN